jgi:hypothetical protein
MQITTPDDLPMAAAFMEEQQKAAEAEAQEQVLH